MPPDTAFADVYLNGEYAGLYLLSEKPQIVVANKMDDEYGPEYLAEFRQAYPDLEIYEISALEHKGIDEVLYKTMEVIEEVRAAEEENAEPAEETVVYRYEPKRPDFTIEVQGPHRFKVVSDKVDRLAEQVDFDKEADTYQFAMTLQKMGIDQALYDAGARNGDQVIVGTYIMDYTE